MCFLIAIGRCDPNDLPEIVNGQKVRVKQFRGAVYR